MNMHKNTPGPGVDQRAAWWVARLDAPDCDAAERAAFEDWLAQAPRHLEAWLRADAIHSATAELAGDELLQAATRKARREGRAVFAHGGWRAWGWAVAASVTVAVGMLAWRLQPQAPAPQQHYATSVGELRTIELADGTELLLDTGSAVTVRLGGRQREVDVDAGRVQLRVGDDPRPFLVHAGGTSIRDIGTTFQVSRDARTVHVGLVEGAVVISAAAAQGRVNRVQLAPGEQVSVVDDVAFAPVQAFDIAVAEGWTQGELVFKGHRLDALLREANRYSRTRLTLADPALAEITVSGVFRAGNQEALVSALERGWGLHAQRVGPDEIRLSR
ncbi:FecR family protein [Aerolutibacter ruishenii]|uniref:FecR family protein n=1 Tax=Aerolutibacter ruishenii TaxID=686800 RepID=A0A562LWE0_9GAMM|nr:FecR domain-containing protein [Lysobacter ruishenii]TWI11916.1 FecR family protein [Lysobacter ruishenii]